MAPLLAASKCCDLNPACPALPALPVLPCRRCAYRNAFIAELSEQRQPHVSVQQPLSQSAGARLLCTAVCAPVRPALVLMCCAVVPGGE